MAASHPVVSWRPPATAAATQEPLTDQIRAAPPAPVTARETPPGSVYEGRCVARDRQRAGGPANHPVAMEVNRDASLSCTGAGSGVTAL